MHPSTHHLGMSGMPMMPYQHPSNEIDMQQALSARTNPSRNNQNTFVYKLGMLISDPKHSDLIFWNSDGKSFTVKNIDEFSKTVLPMHFKHNNFASFIRQLNMYGFHKINRSPRGHRSDPSYQTWEFSHPKFLRDNLELIREIRRTATEPDLNIKPSNSGTDPSLQLVFFQTQQAELIARVDALTSDLAQVKRELSESNRVLALQQQVIRKLTSSLFRQNLSASNSPLLSDNANGHNEKALFPNDPCHPTIFVTPPETQTAHHNSYQKALRMHDNNTFLISTGAETSTSFVNTNYNSTGNAPQNNLEAGNYYPASHQGSRSLLSINTMNFYAQGHLSPNIIGGPGSEASVSDDEYSRGSLRSPINPFPSQQPSGYHSLQLNASPIDPNNHNSNMVYKTSPS